MIMVHVYSWVYLVVFAVKINLYSCLLNLRMQLQATFRPGSSFSGGHTVENSCTCQCHSPGVSIIMIIMNNDRQTSRAMAIRFVYFVYCCIAFHGCKKRLVAVQRGWTGVQWQRCAISSSWDAWHFTGDGHTSGTAWGEDDCKHW